MTKLCSAILVPLMIGMFTVITTIQESRRSQLQCDAERMKIEQQAQLKQEADVRQGEVDTLKIKEERDREDNNHLELFIQVLTILNLPHNQIRDTGVRQLAGVLQINKRLEDGNIAKKEAYVAYKTCSEDPLCRLMATSKTLIFIIEMSILGLYIIDWQLAYEELNEAP
ncbi:unnamed protein product, partial [Rotaria sp. Silwood1]